MEQILIKVNKKMIDIKFATEAEKEDFYINSSHGMVTSVIDKLLEQLKEYELPFTEVATDEE